MHETPALRIFTHPIDEAAIRRLTARRRNQLFGCMHAHNELSFLNRLLMFAQNATAEGELHDQAQSIQMWCILQILAGKLFESWLMLVQRVLRGRTADPILGVLCPAHAASLDWLRSYFGEKNLKNSAIKIIRDKTAFHYDGLELGRAINHLAARENTFISRTIQPIPFIISAPPLASEPSSRSSRIVRRRRLAAASTNE